MRSPKQIQASRRPFQGPIAAQGKRNSSQPQPPRLLRSDPLLTQILLPVIECAIEEANAAAVGAMMAKGRPLDTSSWGTNARWQTCLSGSRERKLRAFSCKVEYDGLERGDLKPHHNSSATYRRLGPKLWCRCDITRRRGSDTLPEQLREYFRGTWLPVVPITASILGGFLALALYKIPFPGYLFACLSRGVHSSARAVPSYPMRHEAALESCRY